jgi:hypothetical protein
MIQFLTNDQIDSERWNECINIASNGNVYGYSWYLDLVCPGWCALVEDEYVRVFPLPAWHKMNIYYLSQPLFTQQLGIYSQTHLSSRELKDFLYKIPHHFKYGDINLNSANKIEASGVNYKYNINYELSLDLPYNELENSYSDNLKRNLRRAEKYSFSVSKDVDPSLLIELFRNNRGSRLKSLTGQHYSLLLDLLNVMIKRGSCEIWGIYDDMNELNGGVSWVQSHNRTVFLFSAVSETGRQKGAMPFLVDTFIRDNAGKEMILDFEGSNDKNLGRFYASFGSKKIFYPRIYFNYLPIYYKVGLKIYRQIRSLLKK